MRLELLPRIETVLIHKPGFLKAILHCDLSGHYRLEVWKSVTACKTTSGFYAPVKAWLDRTHHALLHHERFPPQPDVIGAFLGGHDYLIYSEV